MIKVNKNNQLGNKNKINNSFVSDTLDNSSDFEQQFRFRTTGVFVYVCFVLQCALITKEKERIRGYRVHDWTSQFCNRLFSVWDDEVSSVGTVTTGVCESVQYA